jgi:hypothetical protein
MARQAPIAEGSWTYVINADADPPMAQQPWALVEVDLRDEVTTFPVTAFGRITSPDHPEFIGVVRPDGGAGLMGVPANVLPKLKSTNYPGVIRVAAEGYLPDTQNFTILSNPAFPDSFQSLNLGQWPLHRLPISIFGRIDLKVGSTITPVSGAAIRITKLWRQVPSPVLNPPPDPFLLASLRPTLSASRPVGATLTRHAIAVLPSTFVLLSDMQPGSLTLKLSNTIGLAAGEVLAFDRVDPDHREFIAIAAITGSSAPSQPATVELRFPLAFRHGTAEHVALVPGGPPDSLGVSAIAGDTVLLANSLAAISTGDLVEISGGVATVEYRTVSLGSSVSDVRGLYRLPPLSRVGQIELTANDGVHSPVAQILIPNYDQGQNRVDFILS